MSKLTYYLSLTVVLLTLLGLILGFTSVYRLVNVPVPVFTIRNEPIPVKQSQYRPGEVPQLIADFCKLKDGPTTISATLVGPTTIPLGSYTSDVPAGCYKLDSQGHQIYFPTLAIPLGVEPGLYKMKIIMRHRSNTFRIETVTTQSQSFEIVAGGVIYLP